MAKSYRTSRLWVVTKATLAVWVVLAFFNWVLGYQLFEFWWTFVSIFIFMSSIGLVIQVLGFALFGTNAEYRKARKAGWHPYWDQIPPPFNCDSYAVRLGGIPEPKTTFTPPEDWSLQCLRCGARNEDWAEKCWECKAILERRAAPTPDPRHCYCTHCNQKFFEAKYGDLDIGVTCPYCKTLCRTRAGEDALRAKSFTPRSEPCPRI